MTVKSNKLNDYKKMGEKALSQELQALKSELFKLRLSLAMNGLDNPNKIAETKKNIARVNTILTMKQNGEEIKVKETAKKEKEPEINPDLDLLIGLDACSAYSEHVGVNLQHEPPLYGEMWCL